MKSVSIKVIPQLRDNYSYILYNNLDALIIDPAESGPIIEYANNYNLNIKDVFITHHHKDHTSGVEGIITKFPKANVYSSNSDIENTKFILKNNDEVNTDINSFKIISTPGHTLDHITYYDNHNKILFCGDTLFRLGCGRVFEGTLDQMYLSLRKINELDNNILVYCGHEYTLANLKFLESALNKKNLYSNIRQKIENELKLSKKSVPFKLDEEKKYNLFLNQESQVGELVKEELKLENLDLFKYLRKKKDNF